MMMRDHLGELASFQDPTMSWGFGAGVRMANRLTDQAQMQQYGWAGGNYATHNLEAQRVFAAQATYVAEWPTSHSPFVSRPGLVADLLADLAEHYAE